MKSIAPVIFLSRPPAPSKGGRLRFLTLALVLAFALPQTLSAQELNAYIGAGIISENLYDYAVCNQDNYPIYAFQLSEAQVNIAGVAVPDGWWAWPADWNQVVFVADWNPVRPGECLGGFTIWAGTTGWAPIHFTLGGFDESWSTPARVKLGYNWGPGY